MGGCQWQHLETAKEVFFLFKTLPLLLVAIFPVTVEFVHRFCPFLGISDHVFPETGQAVPWPVRVCTASHP